MSGFLTRRRQVLFFGRCAGTEGKNQYTCKSPALYSLLHVRPGPLQDFYEALLAKGIKPTKARLTLARKIVAITLTLWKKTSTPTN